MLSLTLDSVQAFDALYQKHPLANNNQGGLGPAGAFYLHTALKQFPKTHTVIESGVWRGASTWFIEQSLPNLKTLYCLDPNVNDVDFYKYRSKLATYSPVDFLKQIWDLPDPANTLVFFDDHQDVLERLLLCKKLGIKNIILDDNYDADCGDHQTTYTIPQDKKHLLDGSSIYTFPRLCTKHACYEAIWRSTDNIPMWLAPYLVDSMNDYNYFSLFRWN